MYTQNSNENAYLLNIQHYSLHDGPGIRTLVFLKGCPLHCKWCANPESQLKEPQIAYNESKCISEEQCTKCRDVCEYVAISYGENGKAILNYAKCTNCLKCVDACPSKALTSYGSPASIKDILDKVEKDASFYTRSGGGLTISGGEPLSSGEFTINLLKEAKKRRINTAIETCGFADYEVLKEAAKYLDTIIFDIKCIDEDKHKEFTGVSNKIILENFTKLCEMHKDLSKIVRTPVVPGFNDNEDEILRIIDFLIDKENIKYELLEYHRLGEPKYVYIGRDYTMESIKLSDGKIESLREIVRDKF